MVRALLGGRQKKEKVDGRKYVINGDAGSN
jgi:hypothetical protein